MEKNIKEAMDLKQKRIEKAINHKDLSIAFFNATNSAISLVSAMPIENDKITRERIRVWREWFLEEWRNWFMETTEPETEETPF